MKIGLDLDGVVYPWHEEMYRYFQENRGYSKDIREFWLKDKHLVTAYHVSIPFLYLSTTPREDVLHYISKLAELGELFYITARHPDLRRVTEKFFQNYQLPFKENLIFDEDKANHVRLNRIDYFLDDMPKHVDKLLGLTDVYLYEVTHNLNQRQGYKTVGSFRQFYEIITGAKHDS